jgi:hypothetical protein
MVLTYFDNSFLMGNHVPDGIKEIVNGRKGLSFSEVYAVR